nr:probable cytosol aminopeptidase [Lytechinus pictus]
MNLLLSVNAGSPLPPYLVVVDYNPTGDKEAPVYHAIVGKGVVFDSGGYSLKPGGYMKNMKFDMSGAAISLLTVKLAALLDSRTRIVAVAPLVSNLIGSKATVVDSVIKSRSGKSVEITNTDAEGRLILADAITYARDRFDPQNLITVATLTGAIVYALGEKTSGVFCPRGELGKSFVAASREN